MEDGYRVHQAIHLSVDRRKDCLAWLLPDSMGALSKSVIFPFLKILFSCSVVCPPLSFSMAQLPLTPKPANRHSGCCYFLLLCLHSLSLLDVKPSPLWILKNSASSLSFPSCFLIFPLRADPYSDTGMQITLWIPPVNQ